MAKKITIAVLGSHSALDVCRGAKDLGFNTLVIAEKGREKTYTEYYKTVGSSTSSGRASLGCVDEVIVVDKFSDIIKLEVQRKLLAQNSIFIPHRSFEVYVSDYEAIEKKFKVPIFGNKFLLRFEERTEKPNQYDLLQAAGIKYPKIFKSYKDIDRLVLVKVSEKSRGFERAFFIADSPAEYKTESAKMIRRGIITKEALESAVIEEFILGVQVNFNFFYSVVNERLELIGTDARRQTDLDGLLKLPEYWQRKIKSVQKRIKQEEAGHMAVTILESMLEQALEMGEKFMTAAKEMKSPGVIGPFSLQTCITPGPPKKDIIVFDVSPRMPGSPGISATPYSGYLYGENLSMGKRIAMEIKQAMKKGKLKSLLT
ncbi:MAG: DUF1297 domain-containing protein [Candidatus Daviesbacteria bacterium]|nr:DUF1297 domain-containing protein [Candidatus Daviesbacteria bacterium]